ncbi:MAG: hypothetical protein WB507_14440 [Solirubrobacterales bacterium]
MLGLGRYLVGVAELAALAGFAVLGAARVRERLLPDLERAPALLVSGVLALGLLILVAELVGSFGLFIAAPYLLGVAVTGLGIWALSPRVLWRAGGIRGRAPDPPPPAAGGRGEASTSGPGGGLIAGGLALMVVLVAVIHFAAGVRLRLSTGMTGFDSTWYHGPLAAEFFQTGNTFELHFLAPQYLAWFYPANAELFHAIGMLAFDRDIISPLLNFGWFLGCLFAVWCIGRAVRVGPVSLLLGAIALSVPVLGDQAGEARNDLAGTFFLLAAIAVCLNASAGGRGGRLPSGALVVAGLAAGLAAGTKLNFLPAASVMVVGLVVIAPRGERWRALAAAGSSAIVGGGYWYLRNLAQAGNPLPWVRHLGPVALPAPAQGLGGREGHSVLEYLSDGSVWSHWFLPGLHQGLWIVWPLLGGMALGGLILCLGRGAGPLLRVIGVVGLVAGLTWLLAPTSAEGPAGMPRGFESALRYLTPALVLGMAVLPIVPPLLGRVRRLLSVGPRWEPSISRRALFLSGAALIAIAVAFGGWEQRRYLEHRYARPEFTTRGLDAAFKWARSLSGTRIATTSTRLYPLYGTDLSNHVQYIGEERPNGGYVAPRTCRSWRQLLNAGHYDYVIATRDRIEPGKPALPPTAHWTEGPNATLILRKPPTAIFKLTGPLDPSAC